MRPTLKDPPAIGTTTMSPMRTTISTFFFHDKDINDGTAGTIFVNNPAAVTTDRQKCPSIAPVTANQNDGISNLVQHVV
jgi:hypothetical protein